MKGRIVPLDSAVARFLEARTELLEARAADDARPRVAGRTLGASLRTVEAVAAHVQTAVALAEVVAGVRP